MIAVAVVLTALTCAVVALAVLAVLEYRHRNRLHGQYAEAFEAIEDVVNKHADDNQALARMLVDHDLQLKKLNATATEVD